MLAAMDLLGVAAILPLMQIMMGAPLDEGTLGALHSLLGKPSQHTFVLLLAGGMIATFVLKAVLALWLTWWSARYVARLQTHTARRLLGAYMSESFLTHRRRNTGELIRNVGTAVTDAHARVLGGFLSALSSLLSIVLIVVLLLVVSPVPTLVAVLYFGTAVLLLQRLLGPANRRAGKEAQHTSWVSSHALVDAMHGFREAVLHNARGYFVDKFDVANRRTAEASMRANYYSTLPKYVLELVTMVGLTTFIVVAILTGSADQAMPTMSLFVAATVKMLPLMVALTATVGFIRVGREGLAITVDSLRSLDDGVARAPRRQGSAPAMPPGRWSHRGA
ncbi:ABC transporter ATP-binding protein [Dermacoccus abyssi]|uniref:ABC transporter ATP-binding protein n=1 Tax=Dermacoccus abyssi TaxID=322596 RepID=A0ABX5ZAY5_9MICO|nr:ABC transporter ATP-binding protein [Dermacoccus abyssi]